MHFMSSVWSTQKGFGFNVPWLKTKINGKCLWLKSEDLHTPKPRRDPTTRYLSQFIDDVYSSSHTACGQCSTTIQLVRGHLSSRCTSRVSTITSSLYTCFYYETFSRHGDSNPGSEVHWFIRMCLVGGIIRLRLMGNFARISWGCATIALFGSIVIAVFATVMSIGFLFHIISTSPLHGRISWTRTYRKHEQQAAPQSR